MPCLSQIDLRSVEEKQGGIAREERRKNHRMNLPSRLVMKRLDHSVQGENVAIEVNDVSKGGVGVCCTEILTIGAVYESFLTIWTKEVLHAFLEIVRIEKKEGAAFDDDVIIGLSQEISYKEAVSMI